MSGCGYVTKTRPGSPDEFGKCLNGKVLYRIEYGTKKLEIKPCPACQLSNHIDYQIKYTRDLITQYGERTPLQYSGFNKTVAYLLKIHNPEKLGQALNKADIVFDFWLKERITLEDYKGYKADAEICWPWPTDLSKDINSRHSIMKILQVSKPKQGFQLKNDLWIRKKESI